MRFKYGLLKCNNNLLCFIHFLFLLLFIDVFFFFFCAFTILLDNNTRLNCFNYSCTKYFNTYKLKNIVLKIMSFPTH